MEQDLISVIMPLYNGERYVEKAIESILNQTYNNWELIIVNDGSNDGSLKIAEQYSSPKVKIITQPNRGASAARNIALLHASGIYVKFLDSDDILTDNCLKEQYKQIIRLKSNQIPFGDFFVINSEGNTVYTYIFNLNDALTQNQDLFFLRHWEVLISSPLHRRDSLLNINGFDEELKSGQESDLHFRLALNNFEFKYIPFQTFYYRNHNLESRISNKKQINQNICPDMYLIKKYENLLISKYSKLYKPYANYFLNFYYMAGIKCFRNNMLPEGKAYFDKAKSYHINSIKFLAYYYLGWITGYNNYERLRILIFNIRGGHVPQNQDSLSNYI